MGYGYRLFKVQVANGPAGFRALAMERCGDGGKQHYHDHVQACLDVLAKWRTLTSAPALRASAQLKIKDHRTRPGVKGDPRIRFLEYQVRTDGSILFEVEYGRIGRFPKALAVKQTDDAHISGLATGHPYRCLLMLPDKGKTGVLAVEDVDGTTPARIIPNWLSRASHQRSRKALPAVDARSLRMVAQQVKDLPRLRAMILAAEDASLRLTKKTVTGSSRRKTTKVKLEYKLDTKLDRDRALTWAEQFAGLGDGSLKGNGVVEMANIVDGSLPNVGFTDAVVVIKGPDGTKKVGANKLDELFVYAVSEDRPDDESWCNAVTSAVADMQSWLEVDVFDSQDEDEE